MLCYKYAIFLSASGSPASGEVTGKIFEYSKTITKYVTCDLPEIDLNNVETHIFDDFIAEVIDSTQIYVEMLKTIFDFKKLKTFLTEKDFPILVSGLHGNINTQRFFVFFWRKGRAEALF